MPNDHFSTATTAAAPHDLTSVAADQVRTLDARSIALFEALKAREGERISKDELLAIGWPDRLVHENSLAKAISKLRGALVGTGIEIRSAYGVGYELRIPDGVGRNQSHLVPARFGGSSRHRRVFLTAVGALVVIFALAWAFGDHASTVPFRATPPITSDPMNARATLLWVDDHPDNNRLETKLFRGQGIAVHLARSTDEALNLLAINRYDLVISDLGRGEDRLAGLSLIDDMRRSGNATPVMIYTLRASNAQRQREKERLAADAGAQALAFTPQEVRQKVLNRFKT